MRYRRWFLGDAARRPAGKELESRIKGGLAKVDFKIPKRT